MPEAFWYVLLSGAFLFLLITLYIVEDVKGKRIFLSGFRRFLDRFVGFIQKKIVATTARFLTELLKFLLHHGLQAVIKRALRLVRSVEGRLERMTRRSKKIVNNNESERVRNHLDDIADYKEASALTEKQKQKLRDQ